MFATTFGVEQQASPCSGATQAGHDALPRFYDFFQKNTDNCVETNRASERFFDGNSISQKVKMTAYVG
jgi:hypothetical protein